MKRSKLVIIVLITITSLLQLVGCDVFSETRPYDYGPSIWVCEDPYIRLEILESFYYEESPSDLLVYTSSSDEVYFMSFTYGGCCQICKYSKDGIWRDEDTLLEGECSFGKEVFTIKVDTTSDVLFNGAYDELVFVRE